MRTRTVRPKVKISVRGVKRIISTSQDREVQMSLVMDSTSATALAMIKLRTAILTILATGLRQSNFRLRYSDHILAPRYSGGKLLLNT